MDLPENAYLCQVSHTVSCGACCGLYNISDSSFHYLNAILAERSARFSQVPRIPEAIEAFEEQTERQLDADRPYGHFHHCAFLGLIGSRRSRVGCLLHPSAEGNGGIDLRGLSYYGGLACRAYFCPSCSRLTSNIKRIVRSVMSNWYEYGLVVTETRLLEAVFGEVARRLDRPLQMADVDDDANCAGAVRRLLLIKRDWPFRKNPRDGLCHYFFKDRQHRRPVLNLPGGSRLKSPYHTLFEELVSFLPTREQVAAAERHIDDLFEQLCRTVTPLKPM